MAGAARGKNRVHMMSTDEEQAASSRDAHRRFSVLRDEEDGLGATAAPNKPKVEGYDNVMLGFQNLSISCVDPPKHITANVSGFVVKGTVPVMNNNEGLPTSLLE